MRFTVETWSPEYGVSADEGGLEDSSDTVAIDVEVPPDQWAPRQPLAGLEPRDVVFIDGVRQIDARVWHELDGLVRPGVCASVAAGSVRCTPTAATVERADLFRGLFLEPSAEAGPIHTEFGPYLLQAAGGSTPEELNRAIHDKMTALELGLADDINEAVGALGQSADLIVFDGPLRGRQHVRGVGFVKTQHVQYLPDEQQRVVGQLGAGERTPLFLIAGGGMNRWSWYLRLPGPISHPQSGIVRCELPGCGTVDDATGRADMITTVLPRYASEAHKDSRAPQNLYPIAGLEHQLRRRLGDPTLLDRGLRKAAVAASRNAHDRATG